MSQYDIPDLATPQADRMAPQGVTLPAQPRLVMRLNRRMLVSGHGHSNLPFAGSPHKYMALHILPD